MIRAIIILLFLFSCSDDLTKNDSVQGIANLILEIDRSNDELYIQVETESNLDVNLIDSVIVNIEYVGGVGLDYNENFLLYDNGENGDIIPNNGIYTLIDNVDKIDIPNEQSEIVNINFPSYFKVDDIESEVIPFTLTIKGKKYLATVNIFQNGYIIHTLDKYINIDNTSLGIQINKHHLYIDDSSTEEVCDRIADTYGDNFELIPFDWPDATSNSFNNYFTYESGFSIGSMADCASTGLAIFKFILNDLDLNESVSEEKSIIIYGCGDGICESYYESITSCPGDCNNE